VSQTQEEEEEATRKKYKINEQSATGEQVREGERSEGGGEQLERQTMTALQL
jgi:hypothetical protein